MNILKRLNSLFGKDKPTTVNFSGMSKQQLKKRLTSEQYAVTQQNATESPYSNKYYKCKKDGVYHCVVCEHPLFESKTKFDSGCGWPAYFDEMQEAGIRKIVDKTHGMTRTEVRCGKCDGHLGHLFNDGPNQTRKRYCINSASLNLQEKKE